ALVVELTGVPARSVMLIVAPLTFVALKGSCALPVIVTGESTVGQLTSISERKPASPRKLVTGRGSQDRTLAGGVKANVVVPGAVLAKSRRLPGLLVLAIVVVP